MRASVRSALIFAAAALVALQVAQPASAHLVDREVFENITPTLYNIERRGPNDQTAVPTTTTRTAAPTQTAGSQCHKDDDCATGYHCDVNAGKCVPDAATGKPDAYCTGDSQCQNGFYCYRGNCQVVKQGGQNCYKDSGCSSGHCVNKKCVAPSTLPPGSGCTKSDQCREGFFCQHSRCAAVGGANASCYKNQGCITGVCLNGKCSGQGLGKYGAACLQNNQCESNHCWFGACRNKRNIGQPCSSPQSCKSGNCAYGPKAKKFVCRS